MFAHTFYIRFVKYIHYTCVLLSMLVEGGRYLGFLEGGDDDGTHEVGGVSGGRQGPAARRGVVHWSHVHPVDLPIGLVVQEPCKTRVL